MARPRKPDELRRQAAIYVAANQIEKSELAEILAVVKETESDFMRTAKDERLERLEEKHPKIRRIRQQYRKKTARAAATGAAQPRS